MDLQDCGKGEPGPSRDPIVLGFQGRLRTACGFAGLCGGRRREVGVIGGGRRAVGFAFLEDERTEKVFFQVENFVDCL